MFDAAPLAPSIARSSDTSVYETIIGTLESAFPSLRTFLSWDNEFKGITSAACDRTEAVERARVTQLTLDETQTRLQRCQKDYEKLQHEYEVDRAKQFQSIQELTDAVNDVTAERDRLRREIEGLQNGFRRCYETVVHKPRGDGDPE